MKNDRDKTALQRKREQRIEAFSPSEQRFVNLASVLELKKYEGGGEIFESLGVEGRMVATCDQEIVGMWSWSVRTLGELKSDVGGLDFGELLRSKRFEDQLGEKDRWLIGLEFRADRLEDVERFIEFGRINVVLEHGLAGALVYVLDNQELGGWGGYPRRNYLQGVHYGTIEDVRVGPYIRKGFVLSGLYDARGVVMLAPRWRVLRRESF